MRVAHLVLGGDVAGGQLVALSLARAARGRGGDVVFLSPWRGSFTELVEGEGFTVRRVDVSRLYRLAGILELRRALRDLRVDVLHTHTLLAANVLSRLAARFAGVPVVCHLHIEERLRPQRLPRAISRTLDSATARLCARILVVSEGTRRAYERQGYPARLMEVVPNGIDIATAGTNRHPGLREELGIPDGARLVGEIGRLCDVKGQRELIAALARLPGVHAVLVGDDLEAGGAYREALEREADRLGVRDRVVFAGYRPDADAILEELDLFVLPSWVEGLPLVVLEAMAHRKPVVATPVGGTPELVLDGETGLLVPPRDPERLAQAIKRVLADPELARRLGEAGYARVAERFTEEAMTRRVLEVYDEVSGGPVPRGGG